MKHKIICGATVVLLVLLSASFSFAAMKLGVVHFKNALTQSKAGKAAFDKLQGEGEKRKKLLDNKISEFKRLQQESMIAGGDKHKEIIDRLRDLKLDIEEDQKKYAREMQELELEVLKPVRERIIELVQAEGKKGGYTLVLENRESGTLYFNEAIDLTPTIIKRYDAEYAK